MARDLQPPAQMPERGYYYHYKHDPNGVINNYAYFIDAVGCHTEEDCRPEDQFMQVYRPLYEAFVYTHGMIDVRPLHMFYEPAIVDGKPIARFTMITDPDTIAALKVIRDDMYRWD
jgi:hypothetical protein